MGTFVVGIIVALIALLACFSIYKDKNVVVAAAAVPAAVQSEVQTRKPS